MNFELTSEQRMWKEAVHDFVTHEVKPKAKEVDETGEINWSAIHKMGAIGLLGLNVPEKYGGAGVDAVSAAIAIEELGWGCGSTALSIAAHNGLGCAPLTLFGKEELKQKYLPIVATGRRADGSLSGLAALALTEPAAGSDLRGITCHAHLEGNQWVINGVKMWCTNAGIAEYIITLVRHEFNESPNTYSLILVPTAMEGLLIDPPEKKMGLKGSPTHALCFQQVHVPKEYLLGNMGEGLRQTLQVLDGGRIGIAALSVGLAQAAFEEAIQYARQRKAFGLPIAEQEAIQWMLADAATEIHAARLMVYYAAWLKDQGKRFTKEAAMAKLFASEMAERVCRNA
ncbi:MAG: acyl-CoA dehydrogenase family protein, partial [Anaerolineales bacterium]|nr:acyl-CoA dehydrogenase family protein [Anaerolineales bacterium]